MPILFIVTQADNQPPPYFQQKNSFSLPIALFSNYPRSSAMAWPSELNGALEKRFSHPQLCVTLYAGPDFAVHFHRTRNLSIR